MKCMKVLVHKRSYESWVLKNSSLWGGLLLHDFSLAWFVFVIATLEIILPNHTWNIIISSKPCFVIIKIKINQTLVSHVCYLRFYTLKPPYKSSLLIYPSLQYWCFLLEFSGVFLLSTSTRINVPNWTHVPFGAYFWDMVYIYHKLSM